jgi:hypothetical protein
MVITIEFRSFSDHFWFHECLKYQKKAKNKKGHDIHHSQVPSLK